MGNGNEPNSILESETSMIDAGSGLGQAVLDSVDEYNKSVNATGVACPECSEELVWPEHYITGNLIGKRDAWCEACGEGTYLKIGEIDCYAAIRKTYYHILLEN